MRAVPFRRSRGSRAGGRNGWPGACLESGYGKKPGSGKSIPGTRHSELCSTQGRQNDLSAGGSRAARADAELAREGQFFSRLANSGSLRAAGGSVHSRGSLLDLSVANAGGAGAYSFGGAVDQCVYGLQIQIPAPLRDVVGVTDFMPELWSTTTDFTNFCHKNTLRARSWRAR